MTFFASLARQILRFRLLVIGGWIVIIAVAMITLPSLGSEVNTDPSLFLPASSPSVQASSLGSALVGAKTTSKVTIVAARSGQLTQADEAAIKREAALAHQISGVKSVRFGSVSPSGNAVQLEVDVLKNATNVGGLKPVVAALQRTFANAGAPPGLQLHLAGRVASNVANNSSSNKALGKIRLFSILLIVVLLLIVLRSPIAALVTFAPSIVALLVSQKFIAGLGAHGLQISSVTETLLTVLVLGAGTDYGLFLVYRFREELRAGAEPDKAIVSALTRVGESITASAGTVILALLTLLLASFGLYHDLGVPLALGIVVMLLAGLTLLPALLAVTATIMFPGSLGRRDDAKDRPGLWGRVAGHAVRRPLVVLGAGVVIFGVLALAVTGYKTSNLNKSQTAPAGSDAAAGNALLSADFPQSAVSPSDLIMQFATPVWLRPAPLAAALASLQRSDLFTGITGPLDANGTMLSPDTYARLHALLGDPRKLPLTEPSGNSTVPRAEYDAYRASSQYVSHDGKTVRFVAGLRAGTQQSTAAMDATPSVRAALAAATRSSGAQASGVAGQAAELYDVSSTANGDMLRIIPVAIIAIALLLGLVLRSLVAPLYLVVSIVVSYLAALGLTTFLVIDLGGQQGLVYILPFLMFVFLLALGEDYNILIMTRVREEVASGLPVRAAVVRAIERTGPTITSAGLILAGTFAVFAVAGGGIMGGQLQAIGLGLALGVLLDTFGVRTLLVPSAVVLIGRWNWWPSRLSRPQPVLPADQPGEPGEPGEPGQSQHPSSTARR